ncbi:unnamed protein product [Rhodiola kirilowii]
MASSSMSLVSFLCLCFLVVSDTACDRCLHQPKAAYFSNEDALNHGACGYGSLAVGFNARHLAGAMPSIYKDGAGCGACFQIRCKDSNICSKNGTKVIVTDLNNSHETDLVLSSRAFSDMAVPGMDRDLFRLGIVDVEYRRVPCEYKQNLAVHVEESSKKSYYYLAVTFLYQGGQTEIVGVDVAQVGSGNWEHMSRNFGAVWDTSRVPEGALQFRLNVTSGYNGKYVRAKSVLPQDWKAGQVYDSGVQINDIIAQELECNPCDDSRWK